MDRPAFILLRATIVVPTASIGAVFYCHPFLRRPNKMRVACRSLDHWLKVAVCVFMLSVAGFGQANYDDCMGMYNKFLENRKGPEMPKFQAAITSGKEYLSKCSTLENGDQVKSYVTKDIPRMEEIVQANQEVEELKIALGAKDAEGAFAVGKKVLARNSNNVDVMLALALAGQDAAFGSAPVDKFNDDTLRYAKAALDRLNDPAVTVNYVKGTDCADSRSMSVGAMNNLVGRIAWYKQKDKTAALPYLYRSTQSGCAAKQPPETFQMIGSTYQEGFDRIEADRQAKLKAAGDTDTEETKALYAVELGYIDRMMDAYGRAYNLANADAKYDADRKATLLAKVKELYTFRHDEKADGLDEWLKGLGSKKLPDPTSKVEPVAMPDPAPSASATPNKP